MTVFVPAARVPLTSTTKGPTDQLRSQNARVVKDCTQSCNTLAKRKSARTITKLFFRILHSS